MRGDSERLEYIKQPHIIALMLVALLILSAAVFTGVRRIQDMRRVSSLGTYDACREFIDDEALCRYAAAAGESASRGQLVTYTVADGSTTEITAVEIENPDRLKSVTHDGPREIEAYVLIDAMTYVKDYSDGVWAVYEDPDYDSVLTDVASAYDFSGPNSSDVIELRDRYHRVGLEPCGELTCFKYQVDNPDDDTEKRYIWFDDTEFLLRRDTTETAEIKTDHQYEYRAVTVAAPAPTKTVTAEELEALLE